MSDEQQPGQGWRWIEVGEVFRMKYRRREKRSEAGGEVEGEVANQ